MSSIPLRRALPALALAAAALAPVPAATQAAPLTPAQRGARDILAELININSSSGTLGVGRAARAMAARLLAAGYPAADVAVIGPTPEVMGLVVRLHGRGRDRKPILLMAHLDVVTALRADWSFDPFAFREADGWYYGRGSDDNKSGVATIMANLVRWKREQWVPDRDIVAAFSGDEETDGSWIRWMLKNHRPMIDAEFALNSDGGGGGLNGGKPVTQAVQASEKVFANFRLEVTNPGGHSSVPRGDNAITELADALSRVGRHTFPLRLNEVSRAFFRANAETQPALAADMRAVAQPVPDSAAAARLSAVNPYFNSVMRTTCVATRLAGGHADNALPQLATALVNCRMAPDDPPDSVQATLQRLAGDKVRVKLAWDVVTSPVSPLRPDVLGVVERLTREQFPGAVVTPEMSTGATDGLFTRNAGIPTYGVSSVFGEINEQSRAHGRDERVGVKAFHDAVRFWYDMVKQLAGPGVTP